MSNFEFGAFYVVLSIVGFLAFAAYAALRQNADTDEMEVLGDASLLGREDTNAR